MKHYNNDPRWITARYAGVCSKTGQAFSAGERVFYYPNGRHTFAGQAAIDAANDFRTCAEAEEYYATGDACCGDNY